MEARRGTWLGFGVSPYVFGGGLFDSSAYPFSVGIGAQFNVTFALGRIDVRLSAETAVHANDRQGLLRWCATERVARSPSRGCRDEKTGAGR